MFPRPVSREVHLFTYCIEWLDVAFKGEPMLFSRRPLELGVKQNLF